MKAAAPSARAGSEFDRFLFTPLGDDPNGLPLSVVSLLARMNLDPWQEAGTLAALPVEAAARRLASSLDTLRYPLLREANSETRVLRLLALLPRSGSVAPGGPPPSADTVAPVSGIRLRSIVFIASTIVLIVGSQIIATHREARIQSAVSPASATAPTRSVPIPRNP